MRHALHDSPAHLALDPDWTGTRWRPQSAAGAWYGFGRWYGMFPADFARDAVLSLSELGDLVLDPFCGRGNGPFTAAILGRRAMAVDAHPLAWLWTQVKMAPAVSPSRLIERLQRLRRSVTRADRKRETPFEEMAYAPAVMGLLRAARRELDWRHRKVDRTLMGFLALHMQDTVAEGLSNRLAPTTAFSPDYAVRWWTAKGLTEPPDTEPVRFLTDRIRRRYQHGVVSSDAVVLQGDVREVLPRLCSARDAALLLTSPPYCGNTDYWNDHWLRLWLLGHAMRKDWPREQRFSSPDAYQALVRVAFGAARRHVRPDAAVVIRCDARPATADACKEALRATWPGETLWTRDAGETPDGSSRLHARRKRKAREIDLAVAVGGVKTQVLAEMGFVASQKG